MDSSSSKLASSNGGRRKHNFTLPHYNGFDHHQRVAVNPIQRQLLKDEVILQPVACSICGYSRPNDLQGSGYIYTHLENYDDPTAVLPTCKSCHADLHARFKDRGRWERKLYQNYERGRWFTLLSMSSDSQFRPFHETYPNDLPGPYEVWEEEKWSSDIAPPPDTERS